ncbi:MAG TPA: ATP-binding protein [Chitinophagales bacterium]|nr:ATP-binding protein [Chitinophagales bacterium]
MQHLPEAVSDQVVSFECDLQWFGVPWDIPLLPFLLKFPSGKKATHVCPCGYYNHPEKECVCAPGVVQKYLNKISGPLLDRIDLHVEVTPVPFRELSSKKNSEVSKNIRERVIKARMIQEKRFKDHKEIHCNAQMNTKLMREYCVIPPAGENLIKTAMEKLGLSARAYDRILKVSRTIADLAGSDDIQIEHLAEAIQYRSLDKENWAA